ncbi:MAG: hypothetical protein WAO19_07690 [Candidatus Kryptoniota bacterium]
MSLKKRKTAARVTLAFYAFITVTFSLAHKDFVPFESGLSLTPVNPLYHAFDASDDDFVCPAHNFAQSTTGTAALAQVFAPPEYFSIFRTEFYCHLFTAPSHNLSSRDPPQA